MRAALTQPRLCLVAPCRLPLVLLHVGALTALPFGLWMGSTGITFGASVYYWVARQAKEY